MIREPVASAKDLQWYKGLLLEKQRELSSVQGDAELFAEHSLYAGSATMRHN